MKITTVASKPSGLLHARETKEFFADGKPVAVHEKSRDLYCKVTRGTPSNIRTQPKRCDRFTWNFTTLRELLGDKFRSEDFKISGPDHKWGWTGDYLGPKAIEEKLESILNK